MALTPARKALIWAVNREAIGMRYFESSPPVLVCYTHRETACVVTVMHTKVGKQIYITCPECPVDDGLERVQDVDRLWVRRGLI